MIREIIEINKLRKGKTARLSDADIVSLNINLLDAQKNLMPKKFSEIKNLYNEYRKDKNIIEYDLVLYGQRCMYILATFDLFAPFNLFCGNIELNIPETPEKQLYRDVFAESCCTINEHTAQQSNKQVFDVGEFSREFREKFWRPYFETTLNSAQILSAANEDGIIHCGNCGMPVSPQLRICPLCNQKIKKPVSGVRIFGIALLAVIVFFAIMYFLKQ